MKNSEHEDRWDKVTWSQKLGRLNASLSQHLPINKGPAGPQGQNVRRLPQITSKSTIAALNVAATAIRGALGDIKPTAVPGRNERFRQRLLRTVRDSPVVKEFAQIGEVDVRVDVHESFGKPVLVSMDLLLPDPRRRMTELRDLHLRVRPDVHEEDVFTNQDEDRSSPKASPNTTFVEQEHKQVEDFDPHRDLDPELHLPHDQQETIAVLLADLLQRLVEEAWDNPEIAPVAVRGRVIAVHGNGLHVLGLKHTRRHLGVAESETLVLDMRDLGFVDEIARVNDLYDRFGSPKSDRNWRP